MKKNNFRPVDVLKLAVDPEKVPIFCQRGPEK